MSAARPTAAHPPAARERRPDPPPLRTNEYLPAIVGTALWTITFVVLLVRHSAMAAHGQGWWLWVSVVGIAIGVWGYGLVSLRQRSLRRAAAAAAANTAEVGEVAAAAPGAPPVRDEWPPAPPAST
ncbi:MAG: DUF2530 domain-containing protein [Acidothermaceae bacterium]